MKWKPTSFLECVGCRGDLVFEGGTEDIVCPDCGMHYPVFAGRFPVFIYKPMAALSNAYLGYTEAISTRGHQLERLALNSHRHPEAARATREALEWQRDLYDRVREHIAPHINLHELAYQSLKSKPIHMDYEYRFNYLRKDWAPGVHEQGEWEQLQPLLRRSFSGEGERGKALVLGSGMGRSASCIAEGYDEVHAFDSSFTMATLLAELLQGDIQFPDLKEASITSNENLVRYRVASMPPDIRERWAGPGQRIQHWLGDVRTPQFGKESFDAIYSVFFSDVRPLSEWLVKILETLKPGGEFVHIGPLSYHFSRPSEHYSLSEFRELMLSLGLEATEEDTFEGTHCRSDAVGNYKVYRSWYLRFRKARSYSERISAREKLTLVAPVTWRSQGHIPAESEEERYEMYWGEGKSCEVSDTILDIVRFLTEARNLEELYAEMETVYGEIDAPARARIEEIVVQLLEKRVLKKV